MPDAIKFTLTYQPGAMYEINQGAIYYFVFGHSSAQPNCKHMNVHTTFSYTY